MITGSELVVTGGILKKEGSRRFTCFGNGNPYHDLVKESMIQSDAEEDSSTEIKHSTLNMDTDVPKMLKQAMIISSESDNMQEMKIKSRETMNISKFVTAITRQLRVNKAEILAAETLGGFAEYQEVVGAVSGLNTWNRKIYAYLNTHHGEKFYTAVTEGGHKQMKIEFVKHARHGGSKDFDVLIKITGSVLAFNLLQSECKQIMKLLETTKYAKESDEDFRLRAIVMCDTMSRKMDYCDLEDLAVAQIISQLDDSVEVHCSRLLALYTTGECGMEWILAIIDEMNKVTQRLGLRGKKNDNNKDHSHQQNQSANQTEQEDSECWRCGRQHDPSGCWSKDAVCHSCDQKGHISSRCQNVKDFRAKNQKRGKGAGKGKDKGKGKGKDDRRANQADKDETHQACEQCGKYHQRGQSCKTQNSVKSKVEKEMAEAMNMTLDDFRKKLKKSTDHTAKKKKDDSADNKKEIKKLQKQVKEMKEAQVAQRAKSDTDSDATEDSGWGSDGDANRSDLCEMVRAPKEAFAAHNSGRYTNGEAAQAEGCDFERTIEDDRSSDVIISLWDSDESDSDYTEGLNEVHVINMTQKSKQEKKSDKKKARLKKTVEKKRQENKSLESTPEDEPTSDSDTKQAHIERMVTTWQTARNAHGKTCILCDSRVQNPECAGQLCYACCDSTRVENYKCSACCEFSTIRTGKIREKMMELNETNGRPSRAERNENCGWHDEEEDKDLEGLPHISQTWYNDSKTSDGNAEPKELDDCDEEEFVDCNQSQQSQLIATKKNSSALGWYCDLTLQ